MLSNWIYLILIAIVIVTVLVCIIKFPQARVYVFTFLVIILVGATIYSGVNLHYYYSSEGGIFGYISGIFDTNVVEVEELSFSLKNIEMTQESEEIYSAKVLNPSAISKLEVGEEYSVYVNGQPCSNVTTASDYVTANYEYSFLDEEMTELCHDELSIKFAFYENGTYMSVSTAGGSTAVKYWNYYFQKQNFVVDIKISEYKSTGNNYVDGEYDAENIMRISYIVEGKKEFGQAYPVGSSLTFPEYNAEDFYCWSTTPQEEGINRVNANEYHKFYQDITLYAIFLEKHIVNYISQDNLLYTETVLTGFSPTYTDEPTRADCEFAGWSTDGLTVVDINNYIVESNVDFIALWNVEEIKLTIENMSLASGYDSKYLEVHTSITLTSPEDIECLNDTATFSHWEIVSGDGTIVGNQFTAGSKDCTIRAVYDKTIIKFKLIDLNSNHKVKITYAGNTNEITLLESADSCFVYLCCDSSGELILYIYDYPIYFNIETENATLSATGMNYYRIIWEDESFVYVEISSSQIA